ncbi:MAG: DUF4388 domain-containing protein [Polyangiaceae bacterium]|nr:DUF4388 domain-containing protein [Polyangiaceae bacterium]
MNRPIVPDETLSAKSDEETASPFAVADYVQLAGMSGRSIVLEIRGLVAGRGTIVIRSGMLWSARDERGTGFDAFRRLTFLSDAAVHCSTLDEGYVAEPCMFNVSCEKALLDAARINDEMREGLRTASSDIDGAWDHLGTVRAPTESAVKAKLSAVPPPAESSAGPLSSSPSASRRGMPRETQKPQGLIRETRETRETPLPKTFEEIYDEGTPPSTAFDDADTPRVKTFDELYDEGVEALLHKRFDDAYKAFSAANLVQPGDSRVRTNLERLAQMGYAS